MSNSSLIVKQQVTWPIGDAVGESVGRNVGLNVGNCVGVFVGELTTGMLVGTLKTGEIDGYNVVVGVNVVGTVGDVDGDEIDGDLDGADIDGDFDGVDTDGDFDGGETEGDFEGFSVIAQLISYTKPTISTLVEVRIVFGEGEGVRQSISISFPPLTEFTPLKGPTYVGKNQSAGMSSPVPVSESTASQEESSSLCKFHGEIVSSEIHLTANRGF